MKRFNLPAPAFFFIVATRALLGAGVGLLVSHKLGRRQRKAVGKTLVAIGALTTIPALVVLFGRASEPNPDTPIVAS
jgi:Na+-driven multidrug efflux pump